MYLVIVISAGLDGNLKEMTFEASTYGEALLCQGFWEKKESTIYADIESVDSAMSESELYAVSVSN